MSLNTWLDSNVLNFLNMSGNHFRSKKFSQQKIFATWCLIVKISKNFCLTKISQYVYGHGAILYRNHRLFCCVFDHIVAFKPVAVLWGGGGAGPPQTCSLQNVFVKNIYCVIYKST